MPAATLLAANTSPRSSSPAAHITPVVFDVADNGYIDVESHLAAAIARD
jgi:hypothetical protein